MDLREPSLIASRVGLGIPSGRKYVGTYYIAAKMLHRSLDCPHVRKKSNPYQRCSVYQDSDGSTHVTLNVPLPDGHTNVSNPEMCEACVPVEPLSNDWRERGACWDHEDDRIFSSEPTHHDAFIAEFCAQCPVQLECLLYGERQDTRGTSGGVWGGVYVPRDGKRKVIDQRKKELVAG